MAGQVCIGPEFQVDSAPNAGKLGIKGVGTQSWPVQTGGSAVFGANNGLMYDPTGGLYTAQHGIWRKWNRWNGSSLQQQQAAGTRWINALPPWSFTNPSLQYPVAVQWWIEFTLGVTLTPSYIAVHQGGIGTSANPGMNDYGSAVNSSTSGTNQGLYTMQWTDVRSDFGWSTLAPGATFSLFAEQHCVIGSAGSAQATQPRIQSWAIEIMLQAILIDPAQAGGYQ